MVVAFRKEYTGCYISDLGMPGLDGIELLENLSESGLFRNIPVIILSGDEETCKTQTLPRAGCRRLYYQTV